MRISRLVLNLGLFLALLSQPALATGRFVGSLAFHPKGCEQTRQCYLDSDFGYIDSTGEGWQAKKADLTDGATIPSWAQSFIGQPFDPAFIQAAAIHDHYCDRHVKAMLKTHWVLLDALLSSSVPSAKAKIMYAAVLIGGPKWIGVDPGNQCPIGKMCVESVNKIALPAGAAFAITEDNQTIIARGPTFDDPDVKRAFDDIAARIQANDAAVGLDDITAAARSVPANRFFFDHIEGIAVSPGPAILK